MQLSIILLASASGAGIFGTLFWVFVAAIIVWQLIWLLLKPRESNGTAAVASAESPEETEKSVAAEPESSKPATVLPSRAFTIWPGPKSETPEAKSEDP